MRTIADVINEIIRVEGGYTNNKNDAGGPTNFGITQATLSSWRGAAATATDVKNMKKDEAFEIYMKKYVKDPKFDIIHLISPIVAGELTDTGVNMGPTIPSEFLQISLNALNKKATLFPDLLVDGKLGATTANALRLYLNARGTEGEIVLLKILNCLQGARYIDIAPQRNYANEDFVFGWFKNRISL